MHLSWSEELPHVVSKPTAVGDKDKVAKTLRAGGAGWSAQTGVATTIHGRAAGTTFPVRSGGIRDRQTSQMARTIQRSGIR
ncbi:hypothetical protein [uncultured Tateyamaria sp.]|uniref:hypothetical protein n=1 Tax=uncultured Tateyamaria sp. TaxID=455651 RepID=UPI00261A7A70|nr:hypothetical protein [uncultured Tateyamaria sp.]